jgi:O-antigen ligase
MRLWDGAVNFQQDYWVGIYYNRNSLAPVTAVAVIASVGAVISTWGIVRTSRRLLAAFSLIGGLTLSTFAGIELWQSKSQTSPIALAIALGAVTLWMVIRLLTRRARLFSSARPYSASIAFLLTGIVLFFALQFVGDVGGVSSEIVTLNSRRNLWSLSWMGVQEKPWFGWGWMAAWWTEEFFGESSSWSTWGSRWSHNGYHDVLLGGGWIAGSLLLAYLWFVTRSLSQYTFQDVAPRLTLAGFALAASTQESFFTGSHFIWALLIAALAPGRAFSRSISG